jgi:acetate kinase
VNAGASTLKLRVVGARDEPAAAVDVDPWDGSHAEDALAAVAGTGVVDAVGHRVVHGGDDFVEPTLVDDDVQSRIGALAALAPLHQPRAVRALDAARRALPGVPHVACFDTAFHATMPEAARTYAVPGEWRARWGVRRFGFHGLSHSWAARRARALAGGRGGRRVVSCHLGAGASLCAVLDGRSVDTTMGFTPLEGLVMATRSGSVDPGLVLWLVNDAGLDARDVADALDRRSGLAGLAGGSGDMREVLAARGHDPLAALAFGVYVHRLRREIAAMGAALGGIDVLAFTGGVGEHAPEVRAAAVDGLGFLGLGLDPVANGAAEGDADVSAQGAEARTVVVTAREDLEIARDVRRALS